MIAAHLNDAERMDHHYRYQRYIYDLTRTHYLIGRNHLIADLEPGRGDKVLEIGCGTAWNLIRIAARYPEANIYGLDVSDAMLATARNSIRRRGFEGRIRLAQGDAAKFTGKDVFGCTAFERIIFSYALSMIPGWQVALYRAAQHIAPGGSLHIADFGQCEKLPALFKRGFFAFLKHYTVVPRAHLEEEIAKVSLAQGLTYTFDRMHRGYTHYAVLRRPC
jgi:S-adenosylmethionine-diacylgycerolhomoserine-N-methlytransferase